MTDITPNGGSPLETTKNSKVRLSAMSAFLPLTPADVEAVVISHVTI
jgi:hypothetical protein